MMSHREAERFVSGYVRERIAGATLVDLSHHQDARGVYAAIEVSEFPGKLVGFTMKSLWPGHIREGVDSAVASITAEREARQWSAVDL